MKNSTLVRIKVPKALYESALEKALLEAAGKDPKKVAAEKKEKAEKEAKAKKEKEAKDKKEKAKKSIKEAEIAGVVGSLPSEVDTIVKIFTALAAAGTAATAWNWIKSHIKATPEVLKQAMAKTKSAPMKEADVTSAQAGLQTITDLFGGMNPQAVIAALAALPATVVASSQILSKLKQKAAAAKGKPMPVSEALSSRIAAKKQATVNKKTTAQDPATESLLKIVKAECGSEYPVEIENNRIFVSLKSDDYTSGAAGRLQAGVLEVKGKKVLVGASNLMTYGHGDIEIGGKTFPISDTEAILDYLADVMERVERAQNS